MANIHQDINRGFAILEYRCLNRTFLRRKCSGKALVWPHPALLHWWEKESTYLSPNLAFRAASIWKFSICEFWTKREYWTIYYIISWASLAGRYLASRWYSLLFNIHLFSIFTYTWFGTKSVNLSLSMTLKANNKIL